MNRILLALTALFIVTGCSRKDEYRSLAELIPSPKLSAEVPRPDPKMETPRYSYPYSSKRDPFTPLAGSAAALAGASSGSQGISSGELSNLELKGILRDRKGKVALISASDGEPFVLRSGRVYDRKNRIVSGISGIIKENSVILISQNRTVTELSLKKQNEGGSSNAQ
ncbi:MAG: hypothetical protein A3A86_04835 [Elusimicrobia bacterium RIFCSPLOWO2_01_FULL_60_11]|nr:MAG: hypothetical protein A3A86_04835 [Elusimicrobia bacterium RIFCSPLOWO2_01_FULL_60_11]